MTAEPRIFGNSEVIALNDETVGLVIPSHSVPAGMLEQIH